MEIFSRKSNCVAAMLTNWRLMLVASGLFDPSAITFISLWSWYALTVLKSVSSAVLIIGLAIGSLMSCVISDTIASFTSIDARRKVFCWSASSWASVLFVISGSTLLFVVIALSAAYFANLKTLSLCMLTTDLIAASTLTFALYNPFIPYIESLNIYRLRTRSICVERVCLSLYAYMPNSFLWRSSSPISAFTFVRASVRTRNSPPLSMTFNYYNYERVY